jgi:outer membrane immunogenic protein
MLRKFLLSSAAVAAMTVAAAAADLPNAKGAPVYASPPPSFSWTGFYVGINGGYGGSYNMFDGYGLFNGNPFTAAANATTSNGFVGGGTVGFNYEFPDANIVAGLEGDFDGSTIKSQLCASFSDIGTSINGCAGSQLNWLATARARLGYAVTTPFGNILPYVTGGAAFGNVTDYYSASEDLSYRSASRGSGTMVGWTAGAGLEYPITQNLTFKTEYLYADLGRYLIYAQGGVNLYEHETANIVRAGLNWRFDWLAPPAPVVAKY